MMVAVRKNKTEEGATTGAAVFMIYAKIQKNTRPAKPPQQPAVAVPDRRAAPIPTKRRAGERNATKGKAPPRKANRPIADFARNARKGVHPDGKTFRAFPKRIPALHDNVPPQQTAYPRRPEARARQPMPDARPCPAECASVLCGEYSSTCRKVQSDEAAARGTLSSSSSTFPDMALSATQGKRMMDKSQSLCAIV